MATPHKCPICEGQGLVSRPPWLAGDQHTWTGDSAGYQCHACNGTGVVWGEKGMEYVYTGDVYIGSREWRQ